MIGPLPVRVALLALPAASMLIGITTLWRGPFGFFDAPGDVALSGTGPFLAWSTVLLVGLVASVFAFIALQLAFGRRHGVLTRRLWFLGTALGVGACATALPLAGVLQMVAGAGEPAAAAALMEGVTWQVATFASLAGAAAAGVLIGAAVLRSGRPWPVGAAWILAGPLLAWPTVHWTWAAGWFLLAVGSGALTWQAWPGAATPQGTRVRL